MSQPPTPTTFAWPEIILSHATGALTQGVALRDVLPERLLVIEASTSLASVALLIESHVIAEQTVVMGVARSDDLLPAIADVLSVAQLSWRNVHDIACGSGPGGFTSLRIAASLAKGLAVSNKANLYALPSLLLAAAALHDEPGEYFVHSDALRGDRYLQRARVDDAGQTFALGDVTRVSLATLEAGFESLTTPISLVAVGVALVSKFDTRSIQPHARDTVSLASSWPAFGPVSLSEWEPEYGRAAEAQVKWEQAHGKPLSMT